MKKTFLLLVILLFSYSLSFAEEVTATKTVKNFFKENTDLRIAEEAALIYKTSLNKMSLEVIQRATALAKEDGRKTVLERDIEQATEEIFRRAPMTVAELMEKIKQLSIIDLADLSNQVKAYSEELLKKRKE